MRTAVSVFVITSLLTGAALAGGAYREDWESLKQHQPPEWFRDAKLGIYTHWGPITVGTARAPSGMEWYGRQMYEPKHPAFRYHQQRFGDQRTVGYKDVIPRFTAEKFDADAWAELFRRAGARFAGPVAIHHDNFALWDSALTEWDSMDKGPKRDVTGELAKAIRGRGMRFIATFHHAFAWEYYEPAYAYDAADGKHATLYAEPHKPGTPPSKAYLDLWLAKVNEVVDKYQPDLIWFDFGLGKLIPDDYQRRMFAGYYNRAAAWGRQVGVAHKHWNLHRWTGIIDFERGRMDKLTEFPWLTDTSVGPWFHHDRFGYRSVNDLVDVLVDIVSKNGCMLLNVGPDADGTIPAKAQPILLGLGDWLRVNGEAVYDTRPWLVYGEGPTRPKGGAFSERKKDEYTAQDIRFTRSKDGKALYAIALDWPAGELVLQSVQVDQAGPGARVQLLGYDGKVSHRVNEARQPVIRVPDLPQDRRPCQHAFVFKLAGFQVSASLAARFMSPDAIRVPPEKATFEGTQVRVQTRGGRPNIGYWDKPEERAHWLVWIPKAGRYAVRAELSAGYAASRLKLDIAGRSSVADVPRIDWFKPQMVPFGELKFEKPAAYHLILAPADPATWKAVNVWGIQFAPLE